MSRTAARFTQADISRAIRAAKQCGAGSVTLKPDGSILINLAGTDHPTIEQETDPYALAAERANAAAAKRRRRRKVKDIVL